MILIDFFSDDCCKGTELVEGWYWYEDDREGVGDRMKAKKRL